MAPQGRPSSLTADIPEGGSGRVSRSHKRRGRGESRESVEGVGGGSATGNRARPEWFKGEGAGADGSDGSPRWKKDICKIIGVE